MTANPRTNGGLVRRDLDLPDFRDYAVGRGSRPGASSYRSPRVHGHIPARVTNANPSTFRIFGPDETASNRLGAVFEVTDRCVGRLDAARERRAPWARSGRVIEVLSEHLCQGLLEGYLLTGRHGLFNCYEAFIHIIDSMFNQHAKWLKMTAHDSLAAARSPRSTTCSARTSGARTTTASHTRTPASSTTS